MRLTQDQKIMQRLAVDYAISALRAVLPYIEHPDVQAIPFALPLRPIAKRAREAVKKLDYLNSLKNKVSACQLRGKGTEPRRTTMKTENDVSDAVCKAIEAGTWEQPELTYVKKHSEGAGRVQFHAIVGWDPLGIAGLQGFSGLTAGVYSYKGRYVVVKHSVPDGYRKYSDFVYAIPESAVMLWYARSEHYKVTAEERHSEST